MANMSGKNGISTDKTVFLSLLAGETRLCPDKRQILPPRHGHSHDTRAVADNIVVQSKLKVYLSRYADR